ncbi:hypothetical protein PUNSTDRAFT_86234 [Punctularia strigosozonata HHB-11173 SS5]|uniref:uncharacterized protein n=1 Tax=Punctularia strigosozonata (strain HHB-11173) TaxID=741275 RepID=UPI00044172A8|nr:uncharacterized protein PUNSTDRAFT_86234 [Punctularia strigosozonata HHB-11173 SS5]EIN09773.1 hypothetical protein PUNSTDRAFT_86234 [Punctularia strigosozonata HHB-11173 SS5]
MANHKQPGGGFLTGAGAQEEAMCRRSTLFLHLTQTQGTLGKMYPFPKHVSAIWTPGVRVFRDEGAAHYNVWPDHQRFDVAVITAAAVQNPPLDRTGQEFKYVADVQRTRVKMAQILRIAKAQGITHLVLGAFGCGAFGNPPPAIAKLWWEALFQPDVRGAFTEVWFAVIDKSGSSNYPIFHAMFHGKVDSGL